MIKLIKDSYQAYFENDLLHEIAQVGTLKDVKEGQKLIDIGQYLKGMPLVLSGAIKILREDDDGGELLLYYLEKGDICSMTLSCFMNNPKSEVRAIAEMDTQLVMIPFGKMEDWTCKYTSWRNFVFESYHKRINELLHTVDTIAFNNMDERLMKYLKQKKRITKDNIINCTHQEIAYDLHSSRVVISRLLKKLEQMDKIEIHRNYLKILNL
jgi:CRP/FNR family transcriptional regulator